MKLMFLSPLLGFSDVFGQLFHQALVASIKYWYTSAISYFSLQKYLIAYGLFFQFIQNFEGNLINFLHVLSSIC